MAREIEVMAEDPHFGWQSAELERFFTLLDTHPIGRDAPPGTLSLNFVDEAASARLHDAFFGDPAPTDVMTFPGDPDEGHAGDLAVCPAIARAAAAEAGCTPDEEIALYLIHGWLHLAGRRDDEPAATARMRADEATLMEFARAARALPRFHFEGRG